MATLTLEGAQQLADKPITYGAVPVGGSIGQAPTETAIPGPSTIDGSPGTGGTLTILPPPVLLVPSSPPPIVPGSVNTGTRPGQASGCSTCAEAASSPPQVAPQATISLAADRVAIDGSTAASAAPTPAPAKPRLPLWVWFLFAFLGGYAVRSER